MGYSTWSQKHAKKHEKIVTKLQNKNYTKEEIVDYFDYENMLKEEFDFCPLYKDNKKCHDMDELNCYLCACPNFRFNDNGIEKVEDKTKYSLCGIKSKDARESCYGDKIHQDCSLCLIPHAKSYILDNFDYDWKLIMKRCKL
jgi:hypothetical protein